MGASTHGADDRPRLVGREDHQRTLAGLISGARNGISGSMLIRGEPGIGKTALLQQCRPRAVRRSAALAGRVRGRVRHSLLRSAAAHRALERASDGPARTATAGLAGRHRHRERTAAGPVPGGVGVAGPARRGRSARAGGLRRSTTRTGSTPNRSTCSPSWPVGCRPSPWRCCFAMRDDPRLDVWVAGIPTLPAERAGSGGRRRLAERIAARPHRPPGGRPDRPVDRGQSVGPDRPRPGAVQPAAHRVEPGRRADPGRSSPRGALPPPDAADRPRRSSRGCWSRPPTRPGTST